MFVVSLNYVAELTEVDKCIDAHVAYLDKYYSLGKFVLSGRKVPRTGGVILMDCDSREEVDAIIEEDPFFKAKVAEYAVTEFIPTLSAAGLEQFTAANRR
ncbi:YciI family protein [Sedimenticola sp.]|uniref:YciI family protein n=1 Tax=Sedimenticola sp. TaxID=1940285 RepID=UPI003D10ECC0